MLDPLLLHKKLLSQKMGPVLGGPSSALGGPPSQSLYEVAALTHEMDTQAVTTKVKEILLANNVGQKVRRFILIYSYLKLTEVKTLLYENLAN